MSARESSLNSTIIPLLSNQSFFGTKDDVSGFTKCGISLLCDQPLTVLVYQSQNGAVIDKLDSYIVEATIRPTIPNTEFAPKRIAVEITHKYLWITARNANATATTYCRIETQVYNSGFLKHEHDNIALWGQTSEGTQIAVLTDASGALITTASGGGEAQHVIVDSGSVDITTLPAITGTVDVATLPAITGTVAVSSAFTGENSNFVFQPTATNNTVAVYADGVQGVNVAGGWQYFNSSTGKINWYCYASAEETTAYKVSQLNSVYAVVNQQSTLGLAQAQNPWIMVYTRMDSGTNSGGFFKSKLFFGSNAHTDIQGIKLLYTGADPVDIHPEITGINRIQLQFNSALSNDKQLADVQNESILTATLQTTNNSPPNQFAFTMEEFGVDWVKELTLLPVEFGKLKCDIAGQAVVISGAITVSGNRTTQTQTASVIAPSFTSTAFDLSGNSVVDALLLASGAITNGAVRLDYSVDGSTWFPDNTNTATLTSTDPHSVFKGIKTASRYVRVSSGAGSLFRGTLQIVWSSTAL